MFTNENPRKKFAKNPRKLYSRPPIKETTPPPSPHSQAWASPGLTPGRGRPDFYKNVHNDPDRSR